MTCDFDNDSDQALALGSLPHGSVGCELFGIVEVPLGSPEPSCL